jgi:hypothetical protein
MYGGVGSPFSCPPEYLSRKFPFLFGHNPVHNLKKGKRNENLRLSYLGGVLKRVEDLLATTTIVFRTEPFHSFIKIPIKGFPVVFSATIVSVYPVESLSS